MLQIAFLCKSYCENNLIDAGGCNSCYMTVFQYLTHVPNIEDILRDSRIILYDRCYAFRVNQASARWLSPFLFTSAAVICFAVVAYERVFCAPFFAVYAASMQI
jgi:hypothetical protein